MDSTSSWWFRMTMHEAYAQARLWPVWGAVLRRIIPYHFAGGCPACQHLRKLTRHPEDVCLTGQLAFQWQVGIQQILLVNRHVLLCRGALPPPRER